MLTFFTISQAAATRKQANNLSCFLQKLPSTYCYSSYGYSCMNFFFDHLVSCPIT